MRERVSILVLGALCFLLAAPASADIITVGGIDGDFQEIDTAYAAAQDGDTILVRLGVYPKVTIGGNKSVTITSDFPGWVLIEGRVVVLGVSEGKTVVLNGLRATGEVGSFPPYMGYGLAVLNCSGRVRVQNCDFTGADGDPDGWEWDGLFDYEVTGHAAGWDGVLVRDSTGPISFSHCDLVGGDGTNMESFLIDMSGCGCVAGEPGGNGLRVENSNAVTVAHSTATGGRGSTSDYAGGRGGAGVSAHNSFVQVTGGLFDGGDGGGAFDCCTGFTGGPGGHGVDADAGSVAWTLEPSGTGGDGGSALLAGPGPDGVLVGGAGAITNFPGTSRELMVSTPVYDDGSVTVTLSGNPGDQALVFLSSGTGFAQVSGFQGTWLLGPSFGFSIGAIPGGGTLTLVAPAPPLAVEHLGFHLQALVGGVGDAALTGSTALELVDAAFR
jgi:hypothetical protein